MNLSGKQECVGEQDNMDWVQWVKKTNFDAYGVSSCKSSTKSHNLICVLD
jgi:hypothetical protein